MKAMLKTRPQEQNLEEKWGRVRAQFPQGNLPLGPYFQEQLQTGHLVFTLGRYHFAKRMLEGKQADVLELGCNEGIGSYLLAQAAKSVLGVDFDKTGIRWAQKHLKLPNLKFQQGDFLGQHYGSFDAVVSLDVIEHIPRKKEQEFIGTLYRNLSPTGFAIVGTPNKTADKHSSPTSRVGHVNTFIAERLETLLGRKFHNVFMLGANDALVHAGFKPMTHYLLAIAANPK